MLFTLSSSIFLFVAGSTVRASPVVGSGPGPELLNFFGDVVPSSVASQVMSEYASKLPSGAQSAIGAIATQTSGTILLPSQSIPTGIVGGGAVTSAPKHSSTASISSGEAMTTVVSTIRGKFGQADSVSTFVVPISTPIAVKQTSAALATATQVNKPQATIAAGAASAGGKNGTTPTAAGTQCDGTNDGAVVCSADGTKFGLCDHGAVVMMPVSKGTACRDGAINYIADVLDIALGQIKSFLDSSDNATNVFGTANAQAVDASTCPSALLYLKDSVDSADSPTGTGSAGLRFATDSNGKAVVDGQNKDVQLVLKNDGTAGFQVQHECGGSSTSSSSKVRRQDWIVWCLL